ncbi:unnamed protein product [Rhodiola kirilowii]
MTAGSGGQRTIAVVCVFAKNGMDHRCINEHANYRWFSPPYAADCTLDDVLASTWNRSSFSTVQVRSVLLPRSLKKRFI